jgi:hypothetical protein
MTSIPLILHYQPTLHLLTNLIQCCLILPGPYILAQNLNPPGHYILGQREYHGVCRFRCDKDVTLEEVNGRHFP